MGEQQLWQRMLGEPNRWWHRFEQFRLAGPNRTLIGVVNAEKAVRGIQKQAKKTPGAWSLRAEEWQWRKRAEAWDQYLAEKAAAAAEEYRLEILSSGYAVLHERVRALDKLAKTLETDLEIEGNRWLHDVKGIGSGDNFQEVEIVRFNAALIEQFRRTLEDLAAEVGERIKKQDFTSGGEALQINVVYGKPGPDGNVT